VVAIHLRGPGGPARHGLRVWDGEEWLPFPSDPIFDGEIRALASFQGDLFVGGEFGHVGGQTSQYLARWVPD
jgi:hypothetical protein